MTGFAVAWLVIACACLTLGVIHGHVWLRQRQSVGNLAFAGLSLSVAAMAYVEMRMAQATTPQEFGRFLWWYQLPVWTALVALVCFVRVYLRAGHAWLGWAAIGLRTAVLVANFALPTGIAFREVVALEDYAVLGGVLKVVRGVPSPWLVVAHLSLVVLAVFVADATADLWRRGERRRAASIGGGLFVFVAAGTAIAVVAFWGLARMPVFATLLFLPILLTMAFELSLDIIRAVRLTAELDTKRAELAGSEARVALAADAASAGLWSVERATGRVWGTPRALAMFGLAPGREHRMDEILAAVHADDRERVRDFVSGAGEPQDSIEYRVGCGDGMRWYASRGHPAAGNPGEMLGAIIDITARKQAEEATARQRAELEHLSRVATLSELSGTLAHELNQPLATIMSNAEAAQRMLESDAPDLAEVRAILDDIVAADERAGQVISRLREMLKRGEADRRPLSLNGLVEGVVQFLRTELLRRGVAAEVSLDPSVPVVQGDRVPLEQVLINVVTNACDAMSGSPPGARTVTIATTAGEGKACVRISDTGCGLPDPPERAFAPFYTTKAEGLGMGLAISRSIVSAHGGRLWAERNPGGGATFHIELPA
jgi:signal transduction histidine kinase